MGAQYLLRFDDICPTLNWSVWNEIEPHLNRLRIHPILAVVADNQDSGLRVGTSCNDFWERVRAWQKSGWTIGLHGYQHRYGTSESGIVGLNTRSEFAGLSLDQQREKIRRAIEIFDREQVRPEVWIAPAHSFDHSTILALKEQGIQYISDGFFLYPHRDTEGMLWVPQQLWRFRRRPFGVWTVCYHPNGWRDRQIKAFVDDIEAYQDSITNFTEITTIYSNRRTPIGASAVARCYLASLQLKTQIQNWLPVQK